MKKCKGSGTTDKVIRATSHLPPAARRTAQILYTVRLFLASGLRRKAERTDNKVGKILNAFLNDQLLLDDDTGNRTPEHQKLCDKGIELQEKLKEKLNDEDKKLLDRLVNVLFDEAACYAQSKYVRGYQLGVLMTMEVFEAMDTFIIKKAGEKKNEQ